MCTALSLQTKSKETIMGRTMDFSYELDPELYIIPKNYEWTNFYNNYKFKNQYKIMGIGQNIGKEILVDGVNEEGLGVMALYFQGEAIYNNITSSKEKIPVGSIELVNFLLGHCCNVDEVIDILNQINIIGVEDSITNSIAPLHWLVADKNNKCIVIEPLKDGLCIFDNPIKVLANSPRFDWHMTNLRNYMNLSLTQLEQTNLDKIVLKPFGQGGGTFGMPGDYTSPSRFVRIAFQKSNTELPINIEETIITCFNIMKTVTIPKGIIVTAKETIDYTQYTTFITLGTGDYYFNTYYNNQVFKVNINSYDPTSIISIGKIKQPLVIKDI